MGALRHSLMVPVKAVCNYNFMEQRQDTHNAAKPAGGTPREPRRPRGGPRSAGRRRGAPREQDEFDQQMIELSRVTRVMAGGKRMRFRACIVIGDRKGRVGWGVAKGADVSLAIQKATAQAKKNLITVNTVNGTIPHEVRVKFHAARLLLKPAKSGKGLIAGGVVRTVLSLAGVQNIVSKAFGSPNKINNVAATFKALTSLRKVEPREKAPAEKA